MHTTTPKALICKRWLLFVSKLFNFVRKVCGMAILILCDNPSEQEKTQTILSLDTKPFWSKICDIFHSLEPMWPLCGHSSVFTTVNGSFYAAHCHSVASGGSWTDYDWNPIDCVWSVCGMLSFSRIDYSVSNWLSEREWAIFVFCGKRRCRHIKSCSLFLFLCVAFTRVCLYTSVQFMIKSIQCAQADVLELICVCAQESCVCVWLCEWPMESYRMLSEHSIHNNNQIHNYIGLLLY